MVKIMTQITFRQMVDNYQASMVAEGRFDHDEDHIERDETPRRAYAHDIEKESEGHAADGLQHPPEMTHEDINHSLDLIEKDVNRGRAPVMSDFNDVIKEKHNLTDHHKTRLMDLMKRSNRIVSSRFADSEPHDYATDIQERALKGEHYDKSKSELPHLSDLASDHADTLNDRHAEQSDPYAYRGLSRHDF